MTAEVVSFMQQRSGAWSWRINDDEDAALEYLPHSDQVLYIRGLRRYMDYSSGVVGIRRRVSYQMLIELLEVRRDWGSNRPNERLSREAVRQCLNRLERRGLLERLSHNGKAVSLVFKLPLADTDVIPLKKEQQGNNTPSTTAESPDKSKPCGEGTTGEQQGRNNTPPVSTVYKDLSIDKSLSRTKQLSPQSEPALSTLETVQQKNPDAVVAKRSGRAVLWGSVEDLQLAEWMAGKISVITQDDKKPDVTRWADQIRRLRTLDDRKIEQIVAAFKWAHRHQWWQSRIISPEKLRNNWSQLSAQQAAERNRRTPGGLVGGLDTTAQGTRDRLADTTWALESDDKPRAGEW